MVHLTSFCDNIQVSHTLKNKTIQFLKIPYKKYLQCNFFNYYNQIIMKEKKNNKNKNKKIILIFFVQLLLKD